MSKYQTICAKGHVPNWSEEVFVIKKVRNTVPWTYAISDLNREDIVRTFYVKKLQKNKSKRVQREKAISYILNGKVTRNYLTVTLIKRQYN